MLFSRFVNLAVIAVAAMVLSVAVASPFATFPTQTVAWNPSVYTFNPQYNCGFYNGQPLFYSGNQYFYELNSVRYVIVNSNYLQPNLCLSYPRTSSVWSQISQYNGYPAWTNGNTQLYCNNNGWGFF